MSLSVRPASTTAKNGIASPRHDSGWPAMTDSLISSRDQRRDTETSRDRTRWRIIHVGTNHPPPERYVPS